MVLTYRVNPAVTNAELDQLYLALIEFGVGWKHPYLPT
jgi:hypothetical protein